jgi:hypothetical protein
MSVSDMFQAGGVAAVYLLLLSVLCAVLTEGAAALLQAQAYNVFRGIKNLLNAPKSTRLAEQLYTHGLIEGISQYTSDPGKATGPPFYMPPATFSLALLDILGARGVIAGKYGDLLKNAENADDAYEAAVRATTNAARNPELAENINKAKLFQEQARAALQTVADQAKAAYEEARQAASADPGDASIVKLATRLENCVNLANAVLKMHDAYPWLLVAPRPPNYEALVQTWKAAVKETFGVARTFAAHHPDPLSNIEEGLKRLPEGSTKESLLVLIDKTRRDVVAVEHQAEAFRGNLEGWFNNAMQIVDRWYERWTQKLLLWVTLFVVVTFNADAVMLIQRLSQDNVLQASLIAAMQNLVKTQASQSASDQTVPVPSMKDNDPQLRMILEKIDKIKLPVGWSLDPTDPGYFRSPELSLEYTGWVFYKMLGLLISALTIWLIASSWLDIKKSFARRSPGTPPGENQKNASPN